MITVTVICVGRLKDAFFEDAAEEYLKRLKAYAKVKIVEVKSAPLPENCSQAQIAAALEKEGNEIISGIAAGSFVISMCIEGKQYSSEKFSSLIFDTALSGKSHIVFVIGGSYGLSNKVKNISDIKMSMSEMTFPHRLARIMLLEQLYRAFKIGAGEKYHK